MPKDMPPAQLGRAVSVRWLSRKSQLSRPIWVCCRGWTGQMAVHVAWRDSLVDGYHCV